MIGILMEETDLKAIRNLYGVEKIYKLEEWFSFTDILFDAGISIPDVNSYPHHLYGLATAYIDGNEVECNMKIACELLYQAIQYKYQAAYEKLIEIKTGEFVAIIGQSGSGKSTFMITNEEFIMNLIKILSRLRDFTKNI